MLSPDGVRLDLERRAMLYRQRDARSEAAKQRREEVLNAEQAEREREITGARRSSSPGFDEAPGV